MPRLLAITGRHLPRFGALERALLVGVLGSTLFTVSTVSAGAPPRLDASSATEASIARARVLFFKGITQQSAGNFEQALDFFRQSLDEAPTWQGTMNAAFCLDKLARYDEALGLYGDILTAFGTKLDAPERARVEAAIVVLQKKVATLEITANVVASLSVDGRHHGELPRGGPLLVRVSPGTHRVQIVKDGFKPFDRTMNTDAGASIIIYAVLDPVPPPPVPPPPPEQAHEFFTAFAGYAISNSLGSTGESRTTELTHAPVSGFVGGMRGGYRLPFGLAFEVSIGYLFAVSTFHRTVEKPSFFDQSAEPKNTDLTYNLANTLQISGPFLGLGASHRVSLNDRVAFLVRTTIGLLSAHSTDPVTGTVCVTGKCDKKKIPREVLPISVAGNQQALDSTTGLFMPEVGLETSWGHLRAGASLGVVVLTADGPTFQGREVGVHPTTCSAPGGIVSVACAPNKPLWTKDPDNPLKNIELAYGKFAALWVPQIMITYSF